MKNANSDNKLNKSEEELYSVFKNNKNIYPVLKKELMYDIDKDKYYLYENDINNKNKLFQSNILGKKIIKLNNNYIGKLSYEERLNKNLIEKFEHKYDGDLYHPRMKNFDGFTQIPRPISLPLFNYKPEEIENDQIMQAKENIVNYIKNKENLMRDNKYKEVFSRNSFNVKKTPQSLNYFSSSIADEINSKNKRKQKNNMIKYINKSVNNAELTRNQKLSLNKFKNNLLINSKEETNRIKLTKASNIFKYKYELNNNIMFVNPLKYSQVKHDLSINTKTYRLLYNSINNNKLTRLVHNNNVLIKKRNINKSARNLSYKRPNSVLNINNKNRIFIPQKIDFIKRQSKRYDTEREYKNNNKDLNVHSKENITKRYDSEKRHISGFKKPLKKPSVVLRKGKPKFISGKELYKKEMELFKYVNPDIYKREEDENEKRNIFLKKKIEKDRQIKLIKDKKNINIKSKASRLDSAISNLIKDLEYIES